MANLLGQEPSSWLTKQITNRQIVHGSGVSEKRSPEIISYLNSRTAWAKMASSVILQDDRAVEENIDTFYLGSKLARGHVLFAGTAFKGNPSVTSQGKSTTNRVIPRGVGDDNAFDNLFGSTHNGMYNVNPTNERYTGFGAVPMPGIESIDVKAQNRGSIKDITVKMFAYSPEQFRIIDLLYLRLGYTMFIEWGWSHYINNEGKLGQDIISIIDQNGGEGFFQEDEATREGRSYTQLLALLTTYRAKYAGNYDGVVAKVVNYDWTVDENGKYSITVKLKTLGDVIESLKTNLSVSQETGKFITSAYKAFTSSNFEDPGNVPPKPFDNALSAFIFLQLLAVSADPRSDASNNTQEIPCILNGTALSGLFGFFVTSEGLDGSFLASENILNDTFWIAEDIKDYMDTQYEDAKEIKDWDEYQQIKNKPGVYYYIDDSFEEFTVGAGLLALGLGIATVATGGTALLVAGAIATGGLAATAVSGVNYYTVYIKVIVDKGLLKIDGQSNRDIAYFNYNLLDQSGAGAKTVNPNGLYLRLGLILEYINKYIIPYDTKIGKENGKIIKIDTDENSNLMYRIPYQVSLDPRVCIVRNTQENLGDENTKQYYGNNSGGKNSLKNFVVNTSNPISKDFPFSAKLMNIYVNGEHINKIIKSNQNEKGDLNLYKFLSTLCDSLNKALGGINNLEPVIEEDINQIKIIDGSLRKKQQTQSYTFQVFGYNDIRNPNPNIPQSNIYQSNFVRNFDVKTELTNNLATMLSIGSTAAGYAKGTENTAFSRWNQGLIDPFKEILENETDTDSKGKDDEELDALINYKREIWDATYGGYGLTKPKDVPKSDFWDFGNIWVSDVVALSNDKIDSNVSIGTEFYKFLNARLFKLSEKSYASPSQGFLPISFGLTMDGISGFKIYNSLNIDTRFLPKNYTNSMQFILKNVDHSIKNNDWETKVSTVMVAKEGIIREGNILNPYSDYQSYSKAILEIIQTDTSIFKQLGELAKLFSQKLRSANPPSQEAGNVSSEAVANDDTAINDTNLGPAINPTKKGAIGYSSSPVAAQQKSNKQKNGILKQTNPKVLVFIGETQGANKRYINPATNRPEYMLHPSAAKAWFKWRAEMKQKGISYRVSSAYRSVAHQRGLGSGSTVAKPGSSPHGWGGALDFGNLYRIVGGVGDSATNLEGRKTQPYYDIASIGAKYGWYNPHRLADNRGGNTTDEIWHFEYWGPV